MITVGAKFDGHVFLPQSPIELPAGSEVELQIAPAPGTPARSTRAELAEIARQFPVNPDLPADFAAQHDHYLYGTPKRP